MIFKYEKIKHHISKSFDLFYLKNEILSILKSNKSK